MLFIVSGEAWDRSLDSASYKTKIVSDCKTISAFHRAKPRLPLEAKVKVFCVNNEATTTPLTSSALLSSARLAPSVKIKALSVKIASLHETNSTLCKVHPRLSPKAKVKAPLCDSASLLLPAPSAKDFYREVKDKAPSANDLSREARDKAPLSSNSEA